MDVRGRGGTGALLALDAIGKQETHLVEPFSKDNSFFKGTPKRHTQFNTFYRGYKKFAPSEETNWPFGHTVLFNLEPKTSGDLLANAYLKIEMPTLPYFTLGHFYCTQLGLSIIKECTLRLDGVVVDSIKADWNVILSDIYASQNKWDSMYKAIYGAANDVSFPDVTKVTPLYIPLNLFFCRNASDDFTPYLPLCACYNQLVEIGIEFQPVEFFTNAPSLKVPDITLVTEGMILQQDERDHYMYNKQTLTARHIVNQPVQELKPGTDRIFITSTSPVKQLHLFCRNQEFENLESSDPLVFLNRFNFSLEPTLYGFIDYENIFQPLYQIDITYNKTVNVQKFDAPIPASALIVGKTVNNTNLRIPYRNIYSYGFCLDPYSTQSTGSANLSDTIISLESSSSMTTPHNVHVYYSSFKFFKFEGGYGSLLFTQ